MGDHSDQDTFARYICSEMTPTEKEHFESHISECSQCKKELDIFQQIEQALLAGPPEAADQGADSTRIKQTAFTVAQETVLEVAPDKASSFSRLGEIMLDQLHGKGLADLLRGKTDSVAALGPGRSMGGLVSDIVVAAYFLTRAAIEKTPDQAKHKAEELIEAGLSPKLVEHVSKVLGRVLNDVQ